MADLTDCVDFSSSYVNFNRLDHGGFAVTFDCTGDTQDVIIAKASGFTTNAFYLEQLCLGTGDGSSASRVYDASDGGILGSAVGSDVSTGHGSYTNLDYRPNSLICLTADSTKGLCLSSGDGYMWGMVQGSWGPLPK